MRKVESGCLSDTLMVDVSVAVRVCGSRLRPLKLAGSSVSDQ